MGPSLSTFFKTVSQYSGMPLGSSFLGFSFRALFRFTLSLGLTSETLLGASFTAALALTSVALGCSSSSAFPWETSLGSFTSGFASLRYLDSALSSSFASGISLGTSFPSAFTSGFYLGWSSSLSPSKVGISLRLSSSTSSSRLNTSSSEFHSHSSSVGSYSALMI